jgi:hypothetical protein
MFLILDKIMLGQSAKGHLGTEVGHLIFIQEGLKRSMLSLGHNVGHRQSPWSRTFRTGF